MLSKKDVHAHIHCNIIYNNQDMEATCLSVKRWMDKEEVINTQIHTHTGILLSQKRKKFCHL